MIEKWVDKTVAVFSPGAALRRVAQREALAAALSIHRAAERNRSNKDWKAPNVSGDGEVLADKQTIDARARQMSRDSWFVASIKKAFKRNVVGGGITAKSTVKQVGSAEATDDRVNKRIDREWRRWAKDRRKCDVERRRNLVQMQRWAEGELVEVGEAFFIISYKPQQNYVGLGLQCVESEQLDMIKLSHTDEFGITREVRGGVEVDEFSAPVAYWIYPQHPNDIPFAGTAGQWNREDRLQDSNDPRNVTDRGRGSFFGHLHSIRVPADRVVHLYDPERVRQCRGVSRLRPMLTNARDMDMAARSELLAMRASSCIGLIIKSILPHDGNGGMATGAEDDDKDANDNDELSYQPLMTARLDPNEDVASFTPNRPAKAYQDYQVLQQRGAAAGAGVSYEQAVRDFTGGTYSSQRQGGVEDRREFTCDQEILIVGLQEIREQFIFHGVVEGRIVVNSREFVANPDRFYEADWRPTGWEWVDPEKQANGVEKQLAMNLTTLEIECNKQGLDWREVLEQRAREMDFWKAAQGEAAPQLEAKPEEGAPIAPPPVVEQEEPQAAEVAQSAPRRELEEVPA